MAIGGNVKGGEAVGNCAPQGALLPGTAPTGLINADDGGVLDRLAQPSVGLGQGAGDALADRVDRADRDLAAKQLTAEALEASRREIRLRTDSNAIAACILGPKALWRTSSGSDARVLFPQPGQRTQWA